MASRFCGRAEAEAIEGCNERRDTDASWAPSPPRRGNANEAWTEHGGLRRTRDPFRL